MLSQGYIGVAPTNQFNEARNAVLDDVDEREDDGDEKNDDHDKHKNKQANEEKAYIPLDVAKHKVRVVTHEMKVMKQKHLTVIDSISEKYEKLMGEAREQYQAILDEVKTRASARLTANRSLIQSLQDEISILKEQAEIKHKKTNEIRSLRQSKLELEAMVTALKSQQIEYQNEKESLVSRLDDRKGDGDFRQRRIQQLETDKTNVEKRLLESESKLASQSSKLAEAEERLSELDRVSGQLSSMKSKLTHLESTPPVTIVQSMVDERTQSAIRELERALEAARRNEYNMALRLYSTTGGNQPSDKMLGGAEKQTQEQEQGQRTEEVEQGAGQEREEWEDVTVSEEVEEWVDDPSSSSSNDEDQGQVMFTLDSDSPETAASRASLQSSLHTLRSSLSSCGSAISSLEGPLKAQVAEYKSRLALFKDNDAPRVALQDKLGVSRVSDTSEDGSPTTRDLKLSDIDAFQSLLEMDKELTDQRAILQTRVSKLKEDKASLTEMKNNMVAVKDSIAALTASGDNAGAASKEAEYESLKSSAQKAAGEIKTAFSEHERSLAAFKERELAYSKECEKYGFNRDVADGKPRKLTASEKSDVEQLISMWRTKSSERDFLKLTADDVNAKSTQLKALKADKLKTEAELAATQAKYDALPTIEEDEIQRQLANFKLKKSKAEPAKKLIKRMVEKTVRRRKQSSLSQSQSSTKSHSQTHNRLGAGAFKLSRSSLGLSAHAPLTPISFPPIPDIVLAVDPSLPSHHAAALERLSASESESTAFRSRLADAEAERERSMQAHRVEIESLRSQLASLNQKLPDARVRELSLAVDTERARASVARDEAESVRAKLEKKLTFAEADAAAREAELSRLRGELGLVKAQLQLLKGYATADPNANGDGSSDVDQVAVILRLRSELSSCASRLALVEDSVNSLTNACAEKEEVILSMTKSHQDALSAAVSSAVSSARSEAEAATAEAVSVAEAAAAAKLAQVVAEMEERERSKIAAAESAAAMAAAEAAAAAAREQAAREAEIASKEAAEAAAKAVAEATEAASGKKGGMTEAEAAAIEEKQRMYEAKIAELEAKIVTLEHDAKNGVGAVRKELEDSFQKEREENEKQISALKSALEAEKSARSSADSRVSVLEKESVVLNATASSAAAKIEAAEGKVSSLTSERDTLQNEKNVMTKELDFFNIRIKEEVKRRKEFQFKYEDAKGKIRVYSRVRPFNKKEVAEKEGTLLRPGANEWTLELNETERDVMGNVKDKWRDYVFDHVFQFGLEGTKGNASQVEVFEECKDFAEMSCNGINTCIFAYGQSGTGKTFTMAGVKPSESNPSDSLLGLKPRMIRYVYQLKSENIKTHVYQISCYMVEIYLDKLEDVFCKLDYQHKYKGVAKKEWPDYPELRVRVDAKKRVEIENVVVKEFNTEKEMNDWCDEAEVLRRTRKTGLNEGSSRSHLVFSMLIQTTEKSSGKTLKGKMSLVDLAGSERADKTNVDGLSKKERDDMMAEGIAINESLRMLKNVFRILGTAGAPLKKGQKAEVVQYRGNMLTELMQDSLGGNAKTLMFVNVGPAASNINETQDSLQYGDYVKNITNEKASADQDFTEQIRVLRQKLLKYEELHGPLPE